MAEGAPGGRNKKRGRGIQPGTPEWEDHLVRVKAAAAAKAEQPENAAVVGDVNASAEVVREDVETLEPEPGKAARSEPLSGDEVLNAIATELTGQPLNIEAENGGSAEVGSGAETAPGVGVGIGESRNETATDPLARYAVLEDISPAERAVLADAVALAERANRGRQLTARDFDRVQRNALTVAAREARREAAPDPLAGYPVREGMSPEQRAAVVSVVARAERANGGERLHPEVFGLLQEDALTHGELPPSPTATTEVEAITQPPAPVITEADEEARLAAEWAGSSADSTPEAAATPAPVGSDPAVETTPSATKRFSSGKAREMVGARSASATAEPVPPPVSVAPGASAVEAAPIVPAAAARPEGSEPLSPEQRDARIEELRNNRRLSGGAPLAEYEELDRLLQDRRQEYEEQSRRLAEGHERFEQQARQAAERAAEAQSADIERRAPVRLMEAIRKMGKWYTERHWTTKLAIGAGCLTLGAGAYVVGYVTAAGVPYVASRLLGGLGMFTTLDGAAQNLIKDDATRFGAAAVGALAFSLVSGTVFREIGHGLGVVGEWAGGKLASAHEVVPMMPVGVAAELAAHDLAADATRVAGAEGGWAVNNSFSTPGSTIMTYGEVPVGPEPAHPAAVHAAPAAPLAAYEVHSKDTMYSVLRQLPEIQGLHGGAQTNAIENTLAKLSHMSPEQLRGLGIASGNLDLIHPGEHIDLQKIHGIMEGVQIKGEGIIAHAQHLSPDQVSHIEHYQPGQEMGETGTHEHLPQHKPEVPKFHSGFGGIVDTSLHELSPVDALAHEQAITAAQKHMVEQVFSYNGNPLANPDIRYVTKMPFDEALHGFATGNEATPQDNARAHVLGYVNRLLRQYPGDAALQKIVGTPVSSFLGATQYGVGVKDTVEQVLGKLARWQVERGGK